MRRLESLDKYLALSTEYVLQGGKWHEVRSSFWTDSLNEAVIWVREHAGPQFAVKLYCEDTKLIIEKLHGSTYLINRLAAPAELDDLAI